MSLGEISPRIGLIPVNHGGTGDTSFTSNYLLTGNGTSAISTLAYGTAYQLLGTNSGVTAFTNLTLSGTINEITVSTAGTAITLSTPQAIATTSSPTFAGLTITGAITATNQTITVQNIVMTGVTSDPVSPVAGQFWYRSDTAQWVGWNGTANVILG